MRRATLSHLLIRMSNRAGELYPAPTASQVPALAANTTGINFAETQKALISGTVFNDVNHNKKLDAGEKGLAGWRV